VKLMGNATVVIDTEPGGLHGTVTNRGPVPIRQPRAQTLEGQASLGEVLAPGETRNVDAEIVPIVRSLEQGPLHASVEESALLAAAGRSFTGPAQVAVAGITTPPLHATNTPNLTRPHKIGIALAVVPLAAAQTLPEGTGGSLLIAAAPAADDQTAVFDLTVPAGTGPLTIGYGGPIGLTGLAEIYDWTHGTWRTLPPPAATRDNDDTLPPAEVNSGLVRFRTRTPYGQNGTLVGALRLPSTTSRGR